MPSGSANGKIARHTLNMWDNRVVFGRIMKRESAVKSFVMEKIGSVGWVEKDMPSCGPLDAICKPLALAPCTSDVHSVWAGSLGERFNLTLGHEGVGEIVEVGELVKDFKPGDKVIVPAITPDWGAIEAQGGMHQHANGLLAGFQFCNVIDGMFSEYFFVPHVDANVALLPEGMDLASATMLSDMVPTGFHGVELAEVEFGDTVAVIGIGPVGLMAVAAAALRGASDIYAVGSRPDCVALAKEYGANTVINYKEGDIVEQIMELTDGKGVDRVVVAGGDNDTLGQAVEMVKPGGKIGNVVYLSEGDYIKIPRIAWGLGMGHKQINGGLMPGGRLRVEKLASLITSGRLDPSKMVSHTFEGFEKVEDALLMMREKPSDLIKPLVII
jgi:threonine dehydrogenase-like Zn-dependent dehydrogenase